MFLDQSCQPKSQYLNKNQQFFSRKSRIVAVNHKMIERIGPGFITPD